VAKEDRGFASMDRAKQREIASKGGKAAHQKGTAHEWTSEEARDAGRKGGIASHQRRREQTGEQTGEQTADERAVAMEALGSSPSPSSSNVGSERDSYSSESPMPTERDE
jgi:general stress protein YciG